MGNCAVITTAPFKPSNVGVYLHWNGGIESVEAFCAAARELGYRSPDTDPVYGLARLTGLLCLFFDLTADTSVGIGRCSEIDCAGDNGVYLVGKDWTIVGRKHADPDERNTDPAKTETIRRQMVIAARTCATACKELS